jgi:galactokinase
MDTLAKLGWETRGVFGSRMTGGGFGGCTVTLVQEDRVKEFKEKVETGYEAAIGYSPSFYSPRIGDGVRELNMADLEGEL